MWLYDNDESTSYCNKMYLPTLNNKIIMNIGVPPFTQLGRLINTNDVDEKLIIIIVISTNKTSGVRVCVCVSVYRLV